MTQKKKGNVRVVSPNGKGMGRNLGDATRHSSPVVFIGPSVNGSDEEYVKVLSGNVDRKKPSFA